MASQGSAIADISRNQSVLSVIRIAIVRVCKGILKGDGDIAHITVGQPGYIAHQKRVAAADKMINNAEPYIDEIARVLVDEFASQVLDTTQIPDMHDLIVSQTGISPINSNPYYVYDVIAGVTMTDLDT